MEVVTVTSVIVWDAKEGASLCTRCREHVTLNCQPWQKQMPESVPLERSWFEDGRTVSTSDILTFC